LVLFKIFLVVLSAVFPFGGEVLAPWLAMTRMVLLG
jgi:hypothetical protein